MYYLTLRVSADPWALEDPFALVKRPQTMKNQEILIMHETLCSLNLSHMDFLDDPAAIHRCRLIISRATQDASPNELMNPEILKKNHHRNTYSFPRSLPAITPAEYYSSCVCIVFLSEASSSSHVRFHCASARTPGPWRVHLAS